MQTIILSMCSAADLVQCDAAELDILQGAAAVQQGLVEPAPGALPGALGIHGQRVQDHGQACQAAEGRLILRAALQSPPSAAEFWDQSPGCGLKHRLPACLGSSLPASSEGPWLTRLVRKAGSVCVLICEGPQQMALLLAHRIISARLAGRV